MLCPIFCLEIANLKNSLIKIKIFSINQFRDYFATSLINIELADHFKAE